jgi:leader peptidase (prepilin peptidase)/N-methyltransferase
MGILFIGAYQRFGLGTPLAAALALIFFLIPLSLIDLEHWILPSELTVPGLAAGLLLALPQGLEHARDAALGAVGGYCLFWALEKVGAAVFRKEALGAGDKHLLAMIGAFLTYQSLLGVVLLSSLQGSLVGITLLLIRGRAGPAPRVPEAFSKQGPPPSTEPSTPGSEGGDPAKAVPSDARVTGAPLSPVESPSPPTHTDLSGPLEKSSSPPSALAGGDESEEDDWVPGPSNLPFGPWLSLAALELLLLGPWLREALPDAFGWLVAGGSPP